MTRTRDCAWRYSFEERKEGKKISLFLTWILFPLALLSSNFSSNISKIMNLDTPPVEAAAQKWVIPPSVCSQSSGPFLKKEREREKITRNFHTFSVGKHSWDFHPARDEERKRYKDNNKSNKRAKTRATEHTQCAKMSFRIFRIATNRRTKRNDYDSGFYARRCLFLFPCFHFPFMNSSNFFFDFANE